MWTFRLFRTNAHEYILTVRKRKHRHKYMPYANNILEEISLGRFYVILFGLLPFKLSVANKYNRVFVLFLRQVSVDRSS